MGSTKNRQSRMFLIDGKPMTTWNVLIGCRFECSYCNVRKLVVTRLKNSQRYAEGMKPRLVSELLARRFRKGQFVFVGYMGDIAWQPKKNVELVLEVTYNFPDTWFLFCSKNPAVYTEWGFEYPENLYLGTTIETNQDYVVSKAPPPAERYKAMVQLRHPKKFVAIEPIMDFHLGTMVDWMERISPSIIEVGPDNYNNDLKEPPPWKVNMLLENLRKICPTVVEKRGLERLR